MNQIDYEYFEWLTSQIDIPNDKTYNELFSLMHNLEFVWTVPRDDNRAHDGSDLRVEFLDGRRGRITNPKGISILEVLVALSRRVAFTGGGDERVWAWRLLKNLRLNKASDPLTNEKSDRAAEILYNLVWRTYERNGQGGFFPLKHTTEDQTKVEIWYQMNAYVIEMGRL